MSFDDEIAKVGAEYDFARHPYFVWLAGPTATRDAFCRSQIPFRFAVEGFSQSLAAVLARTTTLDARLGLAENVAEEHGNGVLERSHPRTFTAFLRALGATDEALMRPCPIAVVAFHRSLLDHCLVSSAERGAAMLGIIEHLYVDISRTIAHAIVARGWVARDGQAHYVLHETRDVAHARDLFTIARARWASDPGEVAEAMRLGAHHFWRLYDALTPTE